MALELAVTFAEDWRSEGEHEAADALVVWADGWYRRQDLERFRMEDIQESGEAEPAVSTLLGARARGQSSKTGPNQGVMHDFPCATTILRARRRHRKAKERASRVSKNRMAALWQSSFQRYGIPHQPMHFLRHTGLSRDVYIGYRTLSAVKTRGRWKGKEGVERYSKVHTYVKALAHLTSSLLERGRRLEKARQ